MPGRSFITALFLAALLFWAAIPAMAAGQATVTVTVIGSGRITKGNAASAKNDAVGNALRRAVEAALVASMPPETLNRDFQALDAILDQDVRRHIREYKILNSVSGKSEYRVLVQATVMPPALVSRQTDEKKEQPRILLALAEQNEAGGWQYWWRENDPVDRSAAAAAMKTALAAQGYTILPPPKRPAAAQALQNPALTFDEILALGRLIEADMVIAGKAQVNRANTMSTGLLSFNASITGQLIHVDTGMEIAAINQSAVATHTDAQAGSTAALSAAGKLAAESLVARLNAPADEVVLSSEGLSMVVHGTANLSNFVKFRKALEGVSGMREIKVKEMKADEVVLEIVYPGGPESLAEALMLNTFDNFTLDIGTVAPDGLTITLAPKAPKN